MTECRDCIMENTSIRDDTLQEVEHTCEEPSIAESTPIPCTFHDSTFEPSPEPRELEKQEIQPL